MNIFDQLISQLSPEQVEQLMAEARAGRNINPRLLALMRGNLTSDSALPNRQFYRTLPGQGGRGGAGIDPSVPGLRLPRTGIANAWRGPLMGHEALETPAPDLYVPGAESTRLRGI